MDLLLILRIVIAIIALLLISKVSIFRPVPSIRGGGKALLIGFFSLPRTASIAILLIVLVIVTA